MTRPLARKTSAGCRCTVPVAEFGLTSLTGRDLDAWVKVHGVELVTDYLGRPAVSIDDAYKLRDHALKSQAAADAQAAIISAAATARQERDRVASAAMGAAMRAGHGSDPHARRRAVRQAVAEFEASLPREVRDRLGPADVSVSWEFV